MFLKMLEKERLKRKWTQEDVALKIGVARPTYANYEKGKREPDFETSQKLADLFDTTIDYLLGADSKVNNTNEGTEEDRLRKEIMEHVNKIEDEKELDFTLELIKKMLKQ